MTWLRLALATLVAVLLGEAAARGAGTARPVGEIAFSCNGDICVMRDDGSGLVRLTRDKWINDYPAWSPDGRTIAFTGILFKTVVYVMSADGSGRRRLTPRGADQALPAWSPDGRTLAYDDNTTGAIAASDTAGGQRHRLVRRPSAAPAWSPDGARLAFVAHDGRRLALTSGELCISTVAGRGIRRIAPNAAFPAWSPHGEEIAFSRNVGGTDAEIWIGAADGRGARRVVAHSAQGGGVSWSPDGTRLAYVWDSDIYTIGLRDGRVRRLTRGHGDNLNPAWRP